MSPDEESDLSRLAAGATVVGDLQVEGDLRIEGIVERQVRCEGHLTVAEGGTVEGEVSADRITVSGRVNGSLKAVDAIDVQEGASVDGSLIAPLASFQVDARVDGDVAVGPESQAPLSSDGTEAAASAT